MKETTYDWLFCGRCSRGRRGREEGGLCVPIAAAGLSTRKERRWFVSAARLCGWQEVARAPLGGEVRRGAQSQQTGGDPAQLALFSAAMIWGRGAYVTVALASALIIFWLQYGKGMKRLWSVYLTWVTRTFTCRLL